MILNARRRRVVPSLLAGAVLVLSACDPVAVTDSDDPVEVPPDGPAAPGVDDANSGSADAGDEPGVDSEDAEDTEPNEDAIRIGAGPEPEAHLLAAILAAMLDAKGFEAEVVERADAWAARQALELGDVDVLPGYTGETWLEHHARPNPPGDQRTSFARVASVDLSAGIQWLRPTFEAGFRTPPADATFAFFTATPDLESLSQLGAALADDPDAVVCVAAEFARREDGWRAVADAYGIERQFVRRLAPADAVEGVVAGECLVGLSSATDGAAWQAGLRPLSDPLSVFPAFVVSVQVREVALDEHEGLAAALQPLPAQLTTAMLGTWNGQVVGGATVEDVAAAAVAELVVDLGAKRLN